MFCSDAFSAQFLYKTVEEDGGGDYTTLEACMNANEQDLTGDGWFDIDITLAWDNADTSEVTIHNYTTTVDDYINIYTTGLSRHDGSYLSSGYRIDNDTVNSRHIEVSLGVDYVTIDGLQFIRSSPGTYDRGGILLNAQTEHATIKNNIFKDLKRYRGAIEANTARAVTIYNNILYGCEANGDSQTGGAIYTSEDQFGIAEPKVYNNTTYGNTTGIYSNNHDKDAIAINNLSYNNTTDFAGTFDSTSDYNFSKDDTAPEAAGNSIWGTTDGLTPDFVDIGSGTEDFHIESTSDAIGEGTDLSGTFTDDIDGDTRSAWDMGADEFVSADIYTQLMIIN